MNICSARTGIVLAIALVAVCWVRPVAADAPPPDPYATARAVLRAASIELGAHFLDVQKRSGSAPDLQDRIDSDLATVNAPPSPPGWLPGEYADAYANIAALDASLVDQLATGKYHDIASVRGLDDVVIKSPADGTMQPVALYIPKAYDPAKPAPFVVFLHGRGWSEATTLGVPFVRTLADATGAIVAAPLARGDIQYADPAPADIYATVDAVEKAFNVAKQRVYLAGYSMGGFGVFEVASAHADIWNALLCISGSMTNEDRNDIVRAFRGKTVYVVSGVLDDNVPFRYSQITVRWLRESNIATRFYAEAQGSHSMATLRPSMSAAWNDMLGGIRSDSGKVNADMMGPLPPLPTLDTRPMPP